MHESIRFLNSLNLNKKDYIILGCSGGPDSMCLLNILLNEGFNVICAHVNHNIRKESTSEYRFLKDYCRKRNIIFEGLEIPPYDDKNESFYRTKRYNFYKSLCDKYKTKLIMTAHHGDDLVETILMRITRGSKLRGYLGFPTDYFEDQYRIIKPLIFHNKDEILKYNEANGIPYVNDATNDEDTYTRNRYRHKVLPFLKSENPNIHLKYLSFSREVESACNFIDRLLTTALEENYRNGKIALDKFNQLDEYLKKCELEVILKDIYKDDITKIREYPVNKILGLLKTGKNFSLNLPQGIVVKREYDTLTIGKPENDDNPYIIEFKDSITLDNGYTIEKVDSSTDTSNYTTRLSSETISLPLVIRTRREGDKMQIKNMEGSKKIKSIMIDEKVPASLRNNYPVVTDQKGNIVWLPGLRKSKFDSEINEKYDIILRYTKKGEKIDEEK